MNESALVLPENKEIAQGINDVTAVALAIIVTDIDTCRQAKEHFGLLNDMEKKIKAFFEPHITKAHDLHKSLTSARASEISKLTPGKTHLNDQVVRWELEEEKKRKAEEARLAEEARKQEEELRLQAAIDAEAEGATEEAAAILDEPVYIAPPIVQKTTPAVSGVATRGTWKATVTDLKALCKAVAEGKVPLMCIQANETFLNAQARNGKGTIQFPGVAMTESKSLGGARK